MANNYHYIRGGSEKVFFDEIDMLHAHGHSVASFSRRLSDNLPSDHSDYFAPYREFEGVPLCTKLFTGLNIVYSFEAKSRFQQLTDRFLPDLIHGHNIYGGLTSSIIDVARSRQIPFLMTLHDYKVICPSYLMLRDGKICELCHGKHFFHSVLNKCHRDGFVPSAVYAIEAYFSRFAGKYKTVRYFICPSKFIRKKCMEAGIDEKKLKYIPNCVNTEEFQPEYGNDGYLLYIGRLSKEKGIMTMIRGIGRLGIPLRIVGVGPMKEFCEEYAAKKNFSGISFEGYKTGHELKVVYQGACAMIFPSECYENAPMTILESLAYGKPVIGARIGGVTELIEDGKDGLLFDSGNAEDLSEKTQFLFRLGRSRMKEMGVSGRRKIVERFNSHQHYKALAGLYQSALTKR